MKSLYLVLTVCVLTNWQQLTWQDKSGTTTEAFLSETLSMDGEATTAGPTNEVPISTEEKIGFQRLKQVYVNTSKVLNVTNKDNPKLIKNIENIFGNKFIGLFGTCMSQDWFNQCKFQIFKCIYQETPHLCLWKLACSQQNCSSLFDSFKGLPISSTTPTPTPRQDTMMSPGKAMLAAAMKSAGIQCDKLYSCLTNSGFSLKKFLQIDNGTNIHSQHSTSSWQQLTTQEQGEDYMTTGASISNTVSTKAPTIQSLTTKISDTDPGEVKINSQKLKQIYANSNKVLNVTNKDNPKLFNNIAIMFGNKFIDLLNTCLGPDWLKQCFFPIFKCSYHSSPKLCLWELACSQHKCSSSLLSLNSTTPVPGEDISISSGRAMLSAAMKSAGIQCDKLYNCLTNSGFSLQKFLQSGNGTDTHSTHHPNSLQHLTTQEQNYMTTEFLTSNAISTESGATNEGEAIPEGETIEFPINQTQTTVPPKTGNFTNYLESQKLKLIYANFNKVFNMSNKDNQKLIMNIVFGSNLKSFGSCLGPGFFRQCSLQIYMCALYNPTPHMCLWKLVCSETHVLKQKCWNLLTILENHLTKQQTSTTSAPEQDSTPSTGSLLVAAAMKSAGIQCNRLYSCLINLGFSLRKYLQMGNRKATNSTYHPGGLSTLNLTDVWTKTTTTPMVEV